MQPLSCRSDVLLPPVSSGCQDEFAILAFFNKTQASVVSSVASIVSGIVSGLALAFNKQTNDRMDEYAKELVILEKSYTAMQYISLISDIKTKDEAIRDLAKSISQGN